MKKKDIIFIYLDGRQLSICYKSGWIDSTIYQDKEKAAKRFRNMKYKLLK